MDYERIRKPQGGGGLSPGKLRSVLLAMDKKKKEEEELESCTFNLRSHVSEIDELGGSGLDNCKDVDVVTILPESSASSAADSDIYNDRRLKGHPVAHPGIRSQDDPSLLDYDSSQDNMSVSSSMFEFQKSERAPQRKPVAPFSKPAPSKWDDAHKWIASPTSNRPKTGQPPVPGVQQRKVSNIGHMSRQSSTKVVVEVPDHKMVSFEEPDTKRIDMTQPKQDGGGQKFVNWEADAYPATDLYVKPMVMVDKTVGESAINLSQRDSSIGIHTTFIPPPSTARSVSMRDMGTEMTPIASQEPSRTGTPVRATTPMRTPNSSRPSTPGRTTPAASPTNVPNKHADPIKDLSDKELQMKTRREIMALGTQLGKMNIAAWASKEDEDKDASTSLKTIAAEQPAKSVIETRAAAWEEAEKAKYMARFKREEMKIEAWESHQKAKTEAELRKTEVEIERMKGRAHDKLMNKLAATRHKAEEKRAAAEEKRNRQAAKTEQQAEYIRKTGRIPPKFSCCNWCF